jgi:hypothetical protein
MLDIGFGALNPKSHFDTIGIMLGRNAGQVFKDVNGVRYTWGELRKMGQEMGVWVPGEVFAELTGDAAKAGTFTKGTIRTAVQKRALIENEARMQLWLQNIRRGVNPSVAAEHQAWCKPQGRSRSCGYIPFQLRRVVHG